jgi:hypothetical protein
MHDPDQRERNRDRRLRAVERTRRYIFEPIIPAADRHRQQDQREPDVIEHASVVAALTNGGQPICYCIVDLSFNRLTR